MMSESKQEFLIRLLNRREFPAFDRNVKRDVDQVLKSSMQALVKDVERLSKSELLFSDETLPGVQGKLMDLVLKFSVYLTNEVKNEPWSFEEYQFSKKLANLTAAVTSYTQLQTAQIDIPKIYNVTFMNELNGRLEKKLGVKGLADDALSKRKGMSSFAKATVNTYTTRFSDIRGIQKIVDEIDAMVRLTIFRQGHFFQCLAGIPGTGKSTLAQAIATAHSDGIAYVLNMTELRQGQVGAAEQGVKEVFDMARNAQKPATIIMDEMDLVFSEDDYTTEAMRTVRTALQVEMEGRKPLGNHIIIVGMTNYYKKLLPAMKRRISKVTVVPPPDGPALLDFLADYTITENRKDFDPLIRKDISLDAALADNLKELLADKQLNSRVTAADIKKVCEIAKISNSMKYLRQGGVNAIIIKEKYMVEANGNVKLQFSGTPIWYPDNLVRAHVAEPGQYFISVPGIEDFTNAITGGGVDFLSNELALELEDLTEKTSPPQQHQAMDQN